MKIDSIERYWILKEGVYFSDEQMEYWCWNLDPAPAVPKSAREALDLAWELAHEVREGQVIPEGTRYLEVTHSGLRERTAVIDHTISPGLAHLRTFDPLPEPEPDWLDAPAVMAVCNHFMDRAVFVRDGDNWWVSKDYAAGTHDLRDVTPLYPKGQNND